MEEEDLKECHSPNNILFNYKSVMIYSLLFSMPIDYVKNSVLMLGSMLNPIVFNEYERIKHNYELNITMDFKMQLE